MGRYSLMDDTEYKIQILMNNTTDQHFVRLDLYFVYKFLVGSIKCLSDILGCLLFFIPNRITQSKHLFYYNISNRTSTRFVGRQPNTQHR